ncbi:MAG: glycosyltransferase, partial [Pseudomonadota bacterium]|nr:glycosyltransferase [Pseudomonadota bacterium]
AIYVFGSLILFNTVAGWASVLLAISFFSAIQLLTLGILGEYVGRLYMESKQRPLYFQSQETGQPMAHPVDFGPEARDSGRSAAQSAARTAAEQKEAS